MDIKFHIRKIIESGSNVDDWCAFVDQLKQNKCDRDLLAQIYTVALNNIMEKRTKGYKKLLVGLANLQSEVSLDSARKTFLDANGLDVDCAVVCVYYAQFEYRHNNRNDASKILRCGKCDGRTPKILIKKAYKNLRENKASLFDGVLDPWDESLNDITDTATITQLNNVAEPQSPVHQGIKLSNLTRSMSKIKSKDLGMPTRPSGKTQSASSILKEAKTKSPTEELKEKLGLMVGEEFDKCFKKAERRMKQSDDSGVFIPPATPTINNLMNRENIHPNKTYGPSLSPFLNVYTSPLVSRKPLSFIEDTPNGFLFELWSSTEKQKPISKSKDKFGQRDSARKDILKDEAYSSGSSMNESDIQLYSNESVVLLNSTYKTPSKKLDLQKDSCERSLKKHSLKRSAASSMIYRENKVIVPEVPQSCHSSGLTEIVSEFILNEDPCGKKCTDIQNNEGSIIKPLKYTISSEFHDTSKHETNHLKDSNEITDSSQTTSGLTTFVKDIDLNLQHNMIQANRNIPRTQNIQNLTAEAPRKITATNNYNVKNDSTFGNDNLLFSGRKLNSAVDNIDLFMPQLPGFNASANTQEIKNLDVDAPLDKDKGVHKTDRSARKPFKELNMPPLYNSTCEPLAREIPSTEENVAEISNKLQSSVETLETVQKDKISDPLECARNINFQITRFPHALQDLGDVSLESRCEIKPKTFNPEVLQECVPISPVVPILEPVPIKLSPQPNPDVNSLLTSGLAMLDQNGFNMDSQLQALPTNSAFKNFVVKGKFYQQIKCIGKGGSCKVYQVLGDDGKMYALKKVKLQDLDSFMIDSYLNEIKWLEKMKGNAYIIELFDWERTNEFLLIVMEKGDTDLAHILKNTKVLQQNQLKQYWKQMLNAVHVIHEAGIVHTDLKPANFLFIGSMLKLIDFGIANSIQANRTSVTREYQMGTLNYMSPEALMADYSHESGASRISRASDVWSLGCMLYLMIFKKTPYQHIKNQHAKMFAIQQGQTINFNGIRDPLLLDCLKGCLRYNKRERFTIQQLLTHKFLEL